MKTVLDTTTVPGVRLLYRLAMLLAAISGTFCVIFCVVLGVHYYGLNSSDDAFTTAEMKTIPSNTPSYRKPAEDSFNRLPNDHRALLALRQTLAQNRQDEAIKSQIRELDYELRVGYFHRRAIMHRTTCLLFMSAILFFVAIQTTNVLKRQIPDPNEMNRKSEPKGSWHFAVVASWLMFFVGLYLGLLLVPPSQTEQMFLAKLVADATTPASPQEGEHFAQQNGGVVSPTVHKPATLPAVPLTEEILAQHWVSFRNFDGNGIGFSDKPPIHWNGKTGENIAWQTEVPLPGQSSPVIWGDQLFLTGADEETQKIFCYHTENGELLWTADVTRQGVKANVSEDVSFAAPTAVVDGRHVYAMFANGELVAVDFTGKLVWRKSFGVPDNMYGFASSPALCFDRLIVQFDNGDGDDGTSKLFALDLNSGEVLWEVARNMPNSWSSPMVKKIGDSHQIIACGNPYAIAYHPENGKEIWRCKCLSGDIGPSPVSLGDVVLVTNQMPRTTAIDATGSGDVTATHILWQGINAMPDTVSPLATEDYFLTLDSGGYLTGYNPKAVAANKRAKFWELEVGDMVNIYSSPIRIGSYVYIFDMTKDNPRAFVIDLSKVLLDDDGMLTEESAVAMVIAENPMAEPCESSPAILNNRLYIRGTNTIYCIQ